MSDSVSFCYYCSADTETAEWDCKICGLSKVGPDKLTSEDVE